MELSTLFVIFLILKLTGTIDWSWWYVTLPLWIMPIVFAGAFVIAFITQIIRHKARQARVEKQIQKFKKKYFSCTILLALTLWFTPAQAEQPNMLIIQVDDQSYEQDQIAMPFLWDKYGAEGTIFDKYFVTTPQCCPSRVSFLTGQYRRTHGVLSNEYQPPLSLVTLPKLLQEVGYYTAHIGKYTNAQDGTPRPEYNYWAAPVKGSTRDRQKDVIWNVNGDVTQFSGLEFDTIKEQFAEVLDEAPNNSPVAIFVNPHAPHIPALAYPEDTGYYAGIKYYKKESYKESDLSDKPSYVKKYRTKTKAVRTAIRKYKEQLDSSASLDQMIFNLDQQLLIAGRGENLVVFYTSDNGLLYGEHWITGKSVPYEEAIHVPAIMWGAGIPEKLDNELRANIDVAPTLARLAGARIPETIEGKDLYGEGHKFLFIEGGGRNLTEKGNIPKWTGVRTKNKVAIDTANTTGECYNLKTDPHQLRAKPITDCPKLHKKIKLFKAGKLK